MTIQYLTDVDHALVITEAENIVDVLSAPGFAPQLARLVEYGTDPNIVTTMTEVTEAYLGELLERDDSDAESGGEFAQARDGAEEVRIFVAFTHNKAERLRIENDPDYEFLARRLRVGRAEMTSTLAARTTGLQILFVLGRDPRCAKLKIPDAMLKRGREGAALIPAHTGAAVSAKTDRELETDKLWEYNERLTQLIELLLNDATSVRLATGEEIVGLDLALLRSAAARRRTPTDPAKPADEAKPAEANGFA